MDSPSDATVIEESIADPRAFATVFDRHAAVVFRFLVRRVGRDTADEILGETFRIAFERRNSFDLSRTNARPWLYGIATNVVAKHRRTEARRLRATARLAPEACSEFPAESVGEGLDATTLWPRVAAAMAALPDGERDALLLYAWEELSYDEIAAALDIPVGTVRSRLNRARSRLRELTPLRGEQHVEAAPGTRIAP